MPAAPGSPARPCSPASPVSPYKNDDDDGFIYTRLKYQIINISKINILSISCFAYGSTDQKTKSEFCPKVIKRLCSEYILGKIVQ